MQKRYHLIDPITLFKVDDIIYVTLIKLWLVTGEEQGNKRY